MFDSAQSSPAPEAAPLTRQLQLECRALAAVPHEFRAVGTWLNYDCALYSQMDAPEDRERLAADMARARAALDGVLPYFDLDADIPDAAPEALAWFRSCLQRAPQQSDPFRITAQMLFRLQHVVVHEPDAAIAAHRETSTYIINELAPEIAGLLDILDREIAQQETDRVRWAEQLSKEADTAVAQIQSISKMVRLISLNASVEAARAGDAGRAFGVIATEVKAMSEAIQRSAKTVTGTVRDLTERL